MNDSPTVPLKTWQFFHSYRKTLGDTFLTKLFNRGSRQILRWAADPDFTTDHERNPLDRMKIILERLSEIGRDDIARGTVSFLAGAIGCELRCLEPAEPDQPTVEAECLDDYPAVTRFHDAIRTVESVAVIRHLWQEAKRELDETYEMAVRVG